MKEIIVNIYLIIENGLVTGFKAKAYEREGTDNEKIDFLKRNARSGVDSAYVFDAPADKFGKFMSYNRFAKFEKRGMHYRLFEEIFTEFKVPDKPLICVTPIVDGEFYGEEF